MNRGRQAYPILTWFAANPVVANLLMVTILVAGIFTTFTIRREAFPAFDVESVSIVVPFLGGTPEDVERGVAIKVEEAIEGVEGVEHVRSACTENRAEITVEAIEGYDIPTLLDDVKVQVDAIPSFPAQAENPVIAENPQREHVLWVEVHGSASERIRKETARELRDRLLALPSISRITTHGARDYEISVEVSEQRLRALDLTFGEVAEAVRGHSIDLAGGLIRSDRGDVSLRLRNQAYTAGEFAALPLRRGPSGGTIRLGDVAEIRDAFVDQEVLGRFDGAPTVSLQIQTEGDDDIITASRDARETITTFIAEGRVPQGLAVTHWVDESFRIADRLGLLVRNGLIGILLVLVTLAVFLNVRLAIWVAVGIPISLAGAVWIMPWFDRTLNELTSFALIIVLGIIVDDAIVVGESIYRQKRRDPDRGTVDPLEITMRGLGRVVVPAAFGVMTTIAAFLPLTQVSGRMGQAFGQIGIVVIFCLIFSLVESKLILPAHLAHIDVETTPRFFLFRGWRTFQAGVDAVLRGFILRVYQPLLRFAMAWRYTVVALFIAALILVVGAYRAKKIDRIFFPSILLESVQAIVEVEQGLPTSKLHATALEVEAAAWRANDRVRQRTGFDIIQHSQVHASTSQRAVIVVQLAEETNEKVSAREIEGMWRGEVGGLAGVKALTFVGTAGPPGEAIRIQLAGNRLEPLRDAATDLKARLETIAGVQDIKDTLDIGRPEIDIQLTPLGEAMGIDRRQLASEVRDAFYGREAQRVQRGRDEVKVMVRYPQEDRRRTEQLRGMRVRGRDGQSLPFELVATLEHRDGLARIDRRDGRRVVEVKAGVDETITSSEDALQQFQNGPLQAFQQAHPEVRVGFEGEAEQRAKSLRSLGLGFIAALFMIYALLAIPLKSYFKPLLIMSVIPFGIIGALLGHALVGRPVSLLSMFGIVALSGVVVNDSLVFICAVDQDRAEGLGLRAALVKAGGRRFRAILLTSVTTFVGLAPLLLETAVQAQFLIPMAISLAFGILFATPITLVLLPMLYLIGADLAGLVRSWWRTASGQLPR